MAEITQSIEKSTFSALWQQLDHNQRRFAVAMLDSKSKKEAAESIDIKPNTVYSWNGEVDAVVAYLQKRQREAVMEILTQEAVKAAMVKVAGLDSSDEIRRQDAATEILDRVLGRPTQRSEFSGPDGKAIEIHDDRFDAALAKIYGEAE